MTAFPEPSSGCFDGALHRFAVRAYYEDTDLSGIVYHANYLRWFERARSDMLRLLGIDQRAAVEQGIGAYAVTDIAIRYLSPARLDDSVLIESRVDHLGPATCRMHQLASRDGLALCEARLKVGFIDLSGRPRRQPDAWRQAFAPLLATPAPDCEGPR